MSVSYETTQQLRIATLRRYSAAGRKARRVLKAMRAKNQHDREIAERAIPQEKRT